jgi:hypothetical protein
VGDVNNNEVRERTFAPCENPDWRSISGAAPSTHRPTHPVVHAASAIAMAMGMPDGGFPPAKLRTFTNKTMQDNWWEDREQEEYYKKHPLDTSCMVRAARGCAVFVAAPASLLGSCERCRPDVALLSPCARLGWACAQSESSRCMPNFNQVTTATSARSLQQSSRMPQDARWWLASILQHRHSPASPPR